MIVYDAVSCKLQQPFPHLSQLGFMGAVNQQKRMGLHLGDPLTTWKKDLRCHSGTPLFTRLN